MNVHYSSRRQKDDAEGDSEIIRADTLTTGQGTELVPSALTWPGYPHLLPSQMSRGQDLSESRRGRAVKMTLPPL